MTQQTIVSYKRIASKYSLNFVANAFQQGFRFLLLYLAAKALGPEEFGIVSFIILISSYLLNSNLGAVNGLKKQIPLVYLNKGGSFTENAFFSILNFNLIATTVISIVIAVILNRYYDYGFITCMLLVFLSLAGNTYFSVQTYFTSAGKWKDLSALQLVCGFSLMFASLSLIYRNYLIMLGMYAGAFLLASMFFFYKYRYKRQLDKAIIRENIGIGFPVMLSGFIFLLFQTTDRLIISRYYSAVEFGYYSFAWVLVMSLNLLVNVSAEIILQRAASRYAVIPDKRDLLRFILKYAGLLQGMLVIVSVLLLGVVKYVIPIYLKEYESAIPIINNIIIAFVIQQLAMGVASYYYIIGRQSIYNVLLVLSCIINALILFLPVISSDSLPAVINFSWLFIWSSCVYVCLLYLPLLSKKIRR